MSIFTFLGKLIKALLPFLMSAAEKAFKKLPKEQQDKIIQISKLVEVIKQMKNQPIDDVVSKIAQVTGLNYQQASEHVLTYLSEIGVKADNLGHALTLIWQDASERTEAAKKGLWSEFSNLLSSVVANIDWQMLLLGVGEFVYRSFVKGKVKI